MDGIDTNTAAGRMVFSMVGAISEFERNVISERTKAGSGATARAAWGPSGETRARRRIVEGEGRAQVARSLGVDPSRLRRLLMKG